MINLTIEVRGDVVVMMSDLYEPTRVHHSRGVCWGDIIDDIEQYASDVNEYLIDMCKYCDFCGDCEVCDDFDDYKCEVADHVDVVAAEVDHYVLTSLIY